MTKIRKTERIEWEKADGYEPMFELLARLAEGDEVCAHYPGSGGLLVTGKAHFDDEWRLGIYSLVLADAITADVASLEPPRPAWAGCKVVKDGHDRPWISTHDGGWRSARCTASDARALELAFAPITPLIDAEGRPVLSDEDLDRAALAVTRMTGWANFDDVRVRHTDSYRLTLTALRETLGGAR